MVKKMSLFSGFFLERINSAYLDSKFNQFCTQNPMAIIINIVCSSQRYTYDTKEDDFKLTRHCYIVTISL